jgi:hypothetical protein
MKKCAFGLVAPSCSIPSRRMVSFFPLQARPSPAHVGDQAGSGKVRQNQKLAEREGFEPPMGLHPCRISSAVHSTTLPPLRVLVGRCRRGALDNGWSLPIQGPIGCKFAARLDFAGGFGYAHPHSGVGASPRRLYFEPRRLTKRRPDRLCALEKPDRTAKGKKCSQSSKRAASSIALPPTT